MPSEFIKCVDCSDEFEYTEMDQQFYEDKGFSKPKRCKRCRVTKKQRFGDKRESNY